MKKKGKIRNKLQKDAGKGEKFMMIMLDERTEISTNKRKSLNDIRRDVLDLRKQLKEYESTVTIVYDAAIENGFFKDIKNDIYKNILEAEGEED